MRPVPVPASDRNAPARPKSRLLLAAILAGFCLYGLYSLNTLSEVKVDGPYYRSIIQGKDLLAEVMPPPAYLVEAYLCALEMADEEGAALEDRIAAFESHRSAYLERLAHWEALLPDGELRRAFLQESRASGLRMLEAIGSGLIPALRAGDRAAARDLLRGAIRRDFEAHRLSIGKVSELAEARHRQDEARAGLAVSSRTWGQALFGLVLAGLILAGGRRVSSGLEDCIRRLAWAKGGA